MLELIIAARRARLGEYDGSIAVGSSTFGVIGCVIMSTGGIVGCVGDMGRRQRAGYAAAQPDAGRGHRVPIMVPSPAAASARPCG